MRSVVARGPDRLLERKETLASLDREAKLAVGGRGCMVTVQGPAGVGKTALLEEMAGRAERRGIRTLVARGNELEREYPFGIVRQLLDSVVVRSSGPARQRMFEGAARLVEPLFGAAADKAVAPDASGFAVLHGLWWLLANLAAVQPLALLVDDVHWADSPSVRWLVFAGRRIDEIPVLLLASGRRDEPGSPPEWGALRDTAGTALDLMPLSLEASGELLGRRLGRAVAPEFVSACHAATGGNPLFLHELLRELCARGISPDAEVTAAVSRLAPERIARSVTSRLDAQGRDVARLAGAVAILGDSVPVVEAAALAELDDAHARDAAVELSRLGILRPASSLSFEHPIVREAVYDGIPPVLRAGMHRRAADVLERLGAPPERTAAHLLRAEPAADPGVVAVLAEAATAAAARGASDAAARYLARALAEPPPSSDRASLLAELGHDELYSGLAGAAEHLREAAAISTDPELKQRALADLTGLLLLQGSIDAAVAIANEPIGGSAGVTDLAVEAHLLVAATIAGEEAWARVSERLHSLAARAWSGGDEGRPLLAMLALDEIRRGGTQAATAELALAALAGDVLLSRGPDYPPFLFAMYALIRGGRIHEAIEMLERALTVARRRGSLPGYAFASCYMGMAHLLRSELDAGEAHLRGALEAARENDWPLLEWQVLAYLLILLAERGEVAEAQTYLEHAGLEGELPDHLAGTALLSSRAAVRNAQGRWQEAYDDFIECGRRGSRYSERSRNHWWRADAAMALAHLGRHEEALELADAELAMAREWGDPVMIGRALHARGLARGEAGIDDLSAGARTMEGIYELGMASCLVDLGAVLRRGKRRSRARDPLRRALEIAERIGAHGYAERARIELRAAGGRPRIVVRTGVDSLTPSELRICRLAADGMSNPQIAQQLFITRKTVEKHLAGAFLKLGISARQQLPNVLDT
jgi:DNA-binding CsgD family transcriptional regulator